MILHYFWVGEMINGFEREGFNFGSKYFFEYNASRNELTANRRSDLPINFFKSVQGSEQSEIVSLSAIVGENGKGKTSLLKLVKELLHKETGIPQYFQCVIVFQSGQPKLNDPNDYFVYCNTSSHLPFSKPSWISLTWDSYWASIASLSTIYYTNIFDLRHIWVDEPIINISTNYLLQTSPAILSKENANEINPIGAFQTLEMEATVGFVSSSLAHLLPFKPPSVIKLNVWGPNVENFKKSEPVESPIGRLIAQCEDELENSRRSKKNRFLIQLSLEALCSYLSDNEITVEKELQQAFFRNVGRSVSGRTKIKRYLEAISEGYIEAERVNSRNLLLFLNVAERTVRNSDSPFWAQNYTFVPLSTERKDLPALREFFQAYKKAVGRTGFLDFEWNEISSGEQSILSMFSRFHSLLWPTHPSRELNKNIMILIDEGTANFHPDWERRFVKCVVDFFSFVYGSERKIQIILATNSPLVLSDLPKDNLIFLRRDAKEEAPKETFGANIHTLLSHSMFLKSTIGAFAEEKINWLIGRLNVENLPETDFALLQQYIDLIGEPIMQKELQRMLDEKREEDPKWIQAEIERLQKKLPKSGEQS